MSSQQSRWHVGEGKWKPQTKKAAGIGAETELDPWTPQEVNVWPENGWVGRTASSQTGPSLEVNGEGKKKKRAGCCRPPNRQRCSLVTQAGQAPLPGELTVDTAGESRDDTAEGLAREEADTWQVTVAVPTSNYEKLSFWAASFHTPLPQNRSQVEW